MGIWKIEETEAALRLLLPDKDVCPAELQKMRSARRRLEWLAVRVLLRRMLGGEARIAYLPSGAPYLSGRPEHISISHTKDYAAIALNTLPVGIDIESRGERVLRVREHFLDKAEEAALDPFHAADHALLYWCAKEAAYKCIGQEAVDFRKQLHVLPFPFQKQGRLELRESCSPQAALYSLEYVLTDDYALTITLPAR
jgi:phosphopantetheinyl transferase